MCHEEEMGVGKTIYTRRGLKQFKKENNEAGLKKQVEGKTKTR